MSLATVSRNRCGHNVSLVSSYYVENFSVAQMPVWNDNVIPEIRFCPKATKTLESDLVMSSNPDISKGSESAGQKAEKP